MATSDYKDLRSDEGITSSDLGLKYVDKGQLFVRSKKHGVQHGRKNFELGIGFVTKENSKGLLRHFVNEIIPQSAGSNLCLRVDDELFLINGNYIVGMNTFDVMLFSSQLPIMSEKYSLLIRRPSQCECTKDEYKIIKAFITINDDDKYAEIDPDSLVITSPREGDIFVHGNPLQVNGVRISCDRRYFWMDGDKMSTDKAYCEDDKRFCLHVTKYQFCEYTHDGIVCPEKRHVYIISSEHHHGNDQQTAYVRDDKTLGVKEACHPNPPTDKDINTCPPDFKGCACDTILLSSPIDNTVSRPMCILESYNKRNHYLNVDECGQLHLNYSTKPHELKKLDAYIVTMTIPPKNDESQS